MALHSEAMSIEIDGEALAADLVVPERAQGLVIFAHGSGSSRLSPRNRQVAEWLQQAGLATLLMDLLSEREEKDDRRTGEHRFDIPLLARRLVAATDQATKNQPIANLSVGYFGASTGAAAALVAAAERPAVRAVVSRGGRPDMAGDALTSIEAPTLLVVGEHDPSVIELNRNALAELRCEARIEIIPGATHLFEEPGALERVAELAWDWFQQRLGAPAS